VAAARATIPPLLKTDCAEARSKAQVAEHGNPAPVNVHFLAALRAESGLVPFQLSMQQVDLSARLSHLYGGLGVTKSS
jgi:hypothetical protein